MQPNDKNKDQENNQDQPNKTENPLPSGMDQNVIAAHEQAQEDIDSDPEFSASSPNDDLDEGESARLGEDNTGLV